MWIYLIAWASSPAQEWSSCIFLMLGSAMQSVATPQLRLLGVQTLMPFQVPGG